MTEKLVSPMTPRTRILASLAAGIGSFALGHVYLTKLESEVGGGAKVPVLVASEDVAMGAMLSEASVAVRDLPQAYVESRHVRASEVKRVLGVRVTGGLKANETLLWSDLAELGGTSRTLSALVQRGMRAVSIDARSTDFDGLLRPGDRVDVLFTKTSKGDEPGATETLLQNLLVLSVGNNVDRADETPKRGFRTGGSATLSATVEQALLVTQAKERGRLSLTLRNANDIALVDGPAPNGPNVAGTQGEHAR